jgi:hypothetical protein
MQMMRLGAATLVLLTLGMSLQADDSTALKKKDTAHSPKARVMPKTTSSQGTGTTISEVVTQNLMLTPGTSQQVYAQSDFTGADKVSIGVYTTTDQSLLNTSYLIWWAIPNAPNYMVADTLLGSTFDFLNTGGAQLPTYGNQLMIEIRNNGTDPVTIGQVTVYAIAH